MTGGQSNQINGTVTPGPGTPPAATQVDSSSVSTKVTNKAGGITSSSNATVTLCQTGSVLNIMSRPATVTAQNGTPVSVPLQPGMQIVSMRPNQNLTMAAGRAVPQRMIMNPIPSIRAGQPGVRIIFNILKSLKFKFLSPAASYYSATYSEFASRNSGSPYR